jgi:hypothetical protein
MRPFLGWFSQSFQAGFPCLRPSEHSDAFLWLEAQRHVAKNAMSAGGHGHLVHTGRTVLDVYMIFLCIRRPPGLT